MMTDSDAQDAPSSEPLGAYRVYLEEGKRREEALIFIEPGRTPTEEESTLALVVMNTINRIKDLTTDQEVLSRYADEILSAFEMGAVDANKPIAAKKIIEQSIARFGREHLFPEINELINASTRLLMIIAIVSISLAAFSTFYQDVPFFRYVASFAYLHIGLLAGRYISLFLLKSETVNTLEDYDRLKSEVRSPFHGAWLDGVVAFCAVVLFGSQLFNISVGDVSTNWLVANTEGEQKSIEDFWLIATGFGILIGLARSDFITRIRGIASKSLK